MLHSIRILLALFLLNISVQAQTIGRISSNPTTGSGNSVLSDSPTFTGTVTLTGGLKLPSTVVASLPTCNAGATGTLYLVTNALTPVALATVVGGGAVVSTVFCNGSLWIVN